jgi:hypothetical protein
MKYIRDKRLASPGGWWFSSESRCSRLRLVSIPFCVSARASSQGIAAQDAKYSA